MEPQTLHFLHSEFYYVKEKILEKFELYQAK